MICSKNWSQSELVIPIFYGIKSADCFERDEITYKVILENEEKVRYIFLIK